MFARFGNFLIGARNGLEQAGSSPSIDGEEGREGGRGKGPFVSLNGRARKAAGGIGRDGCVLHFRSIFLTESLNTGHVHR